MSKQTKRRELLQEVLHELIPIQIRAYHLLAFTDELEKRTRGEAFVIRNDLVWLTLLDSRDMLFVSFASWAKSLYGTSGFFGRFAAVGLKDLYVRTRPPPGAGHRERVIHASLREAFGRCFPAAAEGRRQLRSDDIEQLRSRFERLVKPVLDNRHYKAHPYEMDVAAQAKLLDVSEVKEVIDEAEGVLVDLGLVVDGSQWATHEHMSWASSSVTAQDLVDLVLFGSVIQVELFMGTAHLVFEATGKYRHQLRDELVDKLFRMPREGGVPFNANEQLERLP